MTPAIKPLIWMGSSKKDLLALPHEVVDVFGYGLHLAQMGLKHPDAKPLSGFGSAGVLEIVEDWRGDTYRAVYYRTDQVRHLRVACVAEEIQAWHCHAQSRCGVDSRTLEDGRSRGQGVIK